jgi:hypothetical protein
LAKTSSFSQIKATARSVRTGGTVHLSVSGTTTGFVSFLGFYKRSTYAIKHFIANNSEKFYKKSFLITINST